MVSLHPINILRVAGIVDGISLIALLFIAMPLKYYGDLPMAVTVVGALHGGIFVAYALSILFTQLRVQWHVGLSFLAFFVAFIPFGNFIFDLYLKKHQKRYHVKPFQKSWIVYMIIFFTFIDLFTQLPVISTFATSVGATAMVAGFIVGIYSLTNTFGNILSGVLTDRYGAFIVLVIGLFATSGSLMLYNFADNVQILVAVRFIHGFLGGLIVPAAFTLLANTTKKDKQGSQSAITGSFVGIAAIVGPAYSGIMANRLSVPFVFTSVAVVGVALAILTLLFLKATATKTVKEQKIRTPFQFNKGIIQSYSGAFFLMFSQGALAYLLPLHVESLGYSSRLSGTLMSMFGIVAVLIFILPTNRLFDKLHPAYSLIFGLSIIGCSQIFIGQMTTSSSLYGALALYGVGFAFLFPAINTLLVRSTTASIRGKAYGYFYAFFSLGVVVGSSGLGMLPLSIGGSFLFTGILLLVLASGVFFTTVNSMKLNKEEVNITGQEKTR
ncbi:MFS transporter [Lysinibacillus sp. 54212]|uniref:MFS transporter n=1 Tax=Lysinibacillus sp. 54212 TaxID=3119829 RepID=UPI003FA57EFB